MSCYRARPALPWVLLGLRQGIYAVADHAFYVSHHLLGDPTYPAIADYPLAVAGLALLIRRRQASRDVQGLLDALSVTVMAGLVSLVMIIGPRSRSDTTLLVKVTSLTYPVMDLALLAVAVRLIFACGRRETPFALLVGRLLAIFAADTLYVLQQLSGTYHAGNYLDAVWLFGNLALGACALHPGMRWLGTRSLAPPRTVTWPQLAVLSAAAFVAPVLLLVNHARGAPHDIPVYGIACAVPFTLTVIRLGIIAEAHRRFAIIDDLTRLHTRRLFEAQLELAVAKAKLAHNPLAVVIIDIDRFKAINDTYGHPAGDRVLIEVAARLHKAIRSGETVSHYGGEEFALIASGTGELQVAEFAERLKRAVSAAAITMCDDDVIRVTVSIGAAVLSPETDSP